MISGQSRDMLLLCNCTVFRPIVKDQAFTRSYDLVPPPYPLAPLSRQQVVYL
jgi:hypothetical protein